MESQWGCCGHEPAAHGRRVRLTLQLGKPPVLPVRRLEKLRAFVVEFSPGWLGESTHWRRILCQRPTKACLIRDGIARMTLFLFQTVPPEAVWRHPKSVGAHLSRVGAPGRMPDFGRASDALSRAHVRRDLSQASSRLSHQVP